LCTGSAKQLGLQKSSIAGRSNGLKGHDVSPLASKDDVNFIGSFFFAKELGHTLSAQMFGALGFPAAFIVSL